MSDIPTDSYNQQTVVPEHETPLVPFSNSIAVNNKFSFAEPNSPSRGSPNFSNPSTPKRANFGRNLLSGSIHSRTHWREPEDQRFKTVVRDPPGYREDWDLKDDDFDLWSTSDTSRKSSRSEFRQKQDGYSSDENESEESGLRTETDEFNSSLKAPSRGRIANIRRESNCSADCEVAYERLVSSSQKVSTGFDDIVVVSEHPVTVPPSASDSARKKNTAPSVGEPISILTNVFLAQSCSPSPTRSLENFKQCYSPSTQQMVRPNIPYSPSPQSSPTNSPSAAHRLTLGVPGSRAPIKVRNTLKRKLTSLEAEVEAKKLFAPKGSSSPLVMDSPGDFSIFNPLRRNVWYVPAATVAGHEKAKNMDITTNTFGTSERNGSGLMEHDGRSRDTCCKCKKKRDRSAPARLNATEITYPLEALQNSFIRHQSEPPMLVPFSEEWKKQYREMRVPRVEPPDEPGMFTSACYYVANSPLLPSCELPLCALCEASERAALEKMGVQVKPNFFSDDPTIDYSDFSNAMPAEYKQWKDFHSRKMIIGPRPAFQIEDKNMQNEDECI
ncbi:unnamed protein product [Caenorhabditis auriculariae]|uniref:Uncharacterized protein n=1 Tax=Caenorhabditis auriculariae TaxID=2777116 RepID=A0A8S1H268_9PELO|nr:unnamed protein product [Caenorhabditis auriculariae]